MIRPAAQKAEIRAEFFQSPLDSVTLLS